MCEYVFTVTHESPKEYRFTIVVKMQNYCLEAIDNLYRADDVTLKKENIQKREDYQRTAITAFRLLDCVTELGRRMGAILPKQQEQIAERILTCKVLLAAWVMSDRKRISELNK